MRRDRCYVLFWRTFFKTEKIFYVERATDISVFSGNKPVAILKYSQNDFRIDRFVPSIR